MKKQMGSSSNSSVDIPMDIIVAILSYLPVKPLARFRCVNKQWLALIHSPQFISMHKTLHADELTYLVFKNWLIFQYDAFFSGNYKPMDDLRDLLSNQYIAFKGSCDGLILLSLNSNTKERVNNMAIRHSSLFIWNPCTGKRMPINTCTHFSFVFMGGYGFGSCKLDGGIVDDYKIIVAQWPPDQQPLLYVYTLSTNSWKGINRDGVRYHAYAPMNHRSSVSINGILYWVSWKDASEEHYLRAIESFDLQREIFRELSLPEGSDAAKIQFNLFVGNYRHCLSLVSHKPDSRMLSAWVLVKKHGVDADHCWEKLFTVGIAPTLVLRSYSGTRVSMTDSRDCSDLVFDIESQQWLQLGDSNTWIAGVAYNESLGISLDEKWQR